ncbi:MAG: acyl-ACP--UDP-N-acetylglucosamine O-acyltransferase [Phycisphaerae bacterium]|nr:acyl-ACP--UDP-N-acetylglucosamine O-acyltransferase [Phycisphaerae bacterium]MDD5380464.1 acyl-ACP--UDP-N-acetylglucosamine O-acyltransferase [Phycisphaerae bacterium]
MIQVHPSAVVSKEARLADGVVIGPNCVIDSGVSIGTGTVLDANVVIGKNVEIGRGNHFYPNCTIGGRPQMLNLKADSEIGKIVIGDNNTIREQVTIHPSIYAGKFTKVGNDNLLMIGVHIGHDCFLEDKIVLSNYVQISGHCKIETGVWLSGVVLVHQFITIGKWCYAAGMAGINKDVPPFLIVSGHYPPKVRGVNKRGLARAGLNEQQQQKIMEAYRKLYRKSRTLLENAKAMEKEDGLDENVRAMLESIIRSSEQRFGRHLEKFRH